LEKGPKISETGAENYPSKKKIEVRCTLIVWFLSSSKRLDKKEQKTYIQV